MDTAKESIILEAARNVFVKYGYQKTSMDDIAKEALMGKGSLYYYFNTKEDIFIAIMENISNEIINNIKTKVSNGKTFREKFEFFLTEPFHNFLSHSIIFVDVMKGASPVFLSKIKGFKEDTQIKLKSILYDIINSGKENKEIKEKFTTSTDRIVNLLFKWVLISGENVNINLTEQNVNEIKGDYLFLADIFLTGLTSKEEH